ncbi:hypothetical protein GF336_05905 [Candidatus Woesearchaeota archaeon]|nr:hypothetical protein [Candidatus Woesearchaeota archaeon]
MADISDKVYERIMGVAFIISAIGIFLSQRRMGITGMAIDSSEKSVNLIVAYLLIASALIVVLVYIFRKRK